jgi:4-hydroxy-2-oxoheptanedioate aldolase
VGVYCGDSEQVKAYQKMGASFFLIAADTMLLKQAAGGLLKAF